MTKRRLTHRQRERIAARQESELNAAPEVGNKDKFGGLVISHYGRQLDIEPDRESGFPRLVRCHQRANLPAMVTGDRVIWQADTAESGVVVAAVERRSMFGRPDPGGEFKPLAANVDLAVVVIAVVPEAFTNLIDRYLAAIENLGLQAMVVLNKADLLNPDNRAQFDSILSLYKKLDYPVARVSALEGTGKEALAGMLAGHTTVLVGQSGVGKSSLINCLAGGDPAPVGNLSEARDKGTHTTTAARLFHLDGFDLIDSPGIREFHLTHCGPEEVLAGFRELRALATYCKFRDCGHHREPGCAIRAAVAAGKLDAGRLENYFHILQSLDRAGH